MSQRSVLFGLVIVAAVGVALWMVFGSRGPDITFTPAPPIATTVSPHDRSIAIRVVQADGRPATDAEVRIGQPRPRWPEAIGTAPVLEPPLGAAHHTDGHGIVILPWRHRKLGDVRVAAQAGDQYAERRIAASTLDGSEFELRLEPSSSLTVKVVDEAGAPVGECPLRITTHASDYEEQECAREVTDAAGVATWPHIQTWMRYIDEVEGERLFTVELYRPGLHVRTEVDANHLPTTPLVLQQPALGRLAVRLVDAGSEPLSNNPIMVSATDRPDSHYWAPYDFPISHDPVSIAVALGKRYSLDATPYMLEPVEVDGPSNPGETAAVTLRADVQTVVTGRLLRNGVPAANCTITGNLCNMGSRTDDDGRFHLLVPPSKDGAPLSSVTIVDATPDGDGATAEWLGRLALDDQVHDIGTLALGPSQMPLLASGHLLATQLEDVSIALIEPSGEPATFPQGPPTTTIRPDGTFEVRGLTESSRLTLRATRFIATKVEFVPGQQDLELVLRDGVRLDASLVVSRDFAACLRLALMRDDGPALLPMPWQHEFEYVNDALQGHWTGLEGGRYRLEVHAAGREQPLRVADNIVLPDRDGVASLEPITLPTLKVVRVTVPRSRRDADYGGRARVDVIDGDAPQPAHADGSGFLFVTERPVDVLVDIPGYRALRIDQVFSDITAKPQPGIAVDIACAVQSLDAEPVHLMLMYGPIEPITIPLREGHARAALPVTGEYEVIAERDTSRGPERLDCEPSSITVGENGGTFEVRLRKP